MNPGKPLVLAIDTSTTCSSVALTTGDVYQGELVATLSLNSKITHSRRLFTGIDWLLGENSLDLADIDGIAVGLGPGSFTGLRIAMATAKGLAAAMAKPLLGVSTLDSLALNCTGDKPLCALIDARKKEVYRRWYLQDERGVYRPHGNIAALTPRNLAREVTETTLFVGDGLLTYGEQIKETIGDSMLMAPRSLYYPSAAAIGFLCCELLETGDILDLESATPLYIRASDAELNLVKKKNN
ncbi:MAG TPA: tRNA (adenosine(37)-N6)-threonylcarbamoyltransferase complex dimerization subunit type 1 TsaB [Desulfocapsa sulfexigens]|nr:tRNA (adenosine(37)-N6)-threonylcarbamoyltransferase complex dimerization subunit type 1 TsaB [Desulfocapsa sulfexigens]